MLQIKPVGIRLSSKKIYQALSTIKFPRNPYISQSLHSKMEQWIEY